MPERPERYVGRRVARPGQSTTRPVVPAQHSPLHDTVPAGAPTVPAPRQAPATHAARIPARAEWTEQRGGRWIAELLFGALLLGTVGCLAMTAVTRSPVWMVSLVVCALVAVIVRGTMISSTRSLVRLEGANLTVRRAGQVDLFNLIDMTRVVETVGTPGSPSWRLRLETATGRVLELGPRQVDAEVMHHAVIYYRTRVDAPRVGGPSWWMFRG